MKLTKYLLFACTAMLLASCGNDDDWNSDANVTVQMADATLKVKENSGMFYVPVEVTGEANGPVRVTVEVAEQGESPAVADKHYVLTSYSIVIPADESEISLEFTATNDMDINDDRTFTVTIVSAEGAKIGDQRTTEVTITDDDSLFYEALQGKWTMTCMNLFDEIEETFSMTFVGVDEGKEGYEDVLYLSGFGGKSNLVAEVGYTCDEATNEITLEFPYGQILGQLNFSGLGVCDVVLMGVTEDGKVTTAGSAVGTVGSDLRSITFDPADAFYCGVFAGGVYQGGWDGWESISLAR